MDFTRARSIWERALELHYRDRTMWLNYAEFEMRNKFVDHSRNVCELAVALFPRVDQLWFKNIHMEEVLDNVEGARLIFEWWMQWQPDQLGWLGFAKFEVKNGEIPRARNVYQRAVDKLADDEDAELLFVAFAEFEEKCKDVEKARCICKSALDHIPKGKAEDLYRKFVTFEKQYGDKEGIEDGILGKRRFQ
ncbi:hypothetical protein Leryth_025045 [Lithospermum erythrorhizon]|nr:hypothetical protein Leryth_025045 [Lithospermum erythrorhizon]